MDIKEIKPGTKLELELHDREGTKLDFNLVSEFEWLIDEKNMMIAAPIHEGNIYPVHIGTQIRVFCVVKKGAISDMYTFKATVTGRDMSNNLSLLKITMTSDMEKVQRRQYYRLDCSVPVKFRVVETMNETANVGIEFKNGLTCDLSGGGICLLLEEKVDTGKMVECEITTGDMKIIKFFGKVVRIDQDYDSGKYRYRAGITFIKINSNDREALVKYIFHEQRKLRKKGLI